jgi:uncharacterized protein (TIGR02466 family)
MNQERPKSMTDANAAAKYDLAMEASCAGYFETPIVTARMKEPGPIIADLTAAIRARMASHPGLERSNVGGWHSDAGMPQWGGPAARALIQNATEAAQHMTRLEGHSWANVTWAVQMWANVSGPGAQNLMHVHPGNLWAAVFYLDLGDDDQVSEDVGGAFYFEDPRFPGTAMHSPGFRILDHKGQPQSWQQDIRPRAGDMILFPAWLRHGVRPYKGVRERISIAMNLNPERINPARR